MNVNRRLNEVTKQEDRMNINSKAGFTLVELMVVAIIVAILAAVAIPLMMGNKDRAMATEAQAGLGTLRTAMQVYKAENGAYPVISAGSQIPGYAGLTVKNGDLDGKYYRSSGYTMLSSSVSNYSMQAVGYTNSPPTVTLDQNGTWGGL
jgi:type II secretion system protein G